MPYHTFLRCVIELCYFSRTWEWATYLMGFGFHTWIGMWDLASKQVIGCMIWDLDLAFSLFNFCDLGQGHLYMLFFFYMSLMLITI